MPEGGLDSRNLREALRNRPVIPPDGLEAVPLFAVAWRVGALGEAGDAFSLLVLTMMCDEVGFLILLAQTATLPKPRSRSIYRSGRRMTEEGDFKTR